MASTPSATPEPMDTPRQDGSSVTQSPLAAGQHDFEAQKIIHQQIRNDPDYDDWEYGTEPLPHEAWIARPQPRVDGSSAGT